jgi:hypothetical protein
MASWRHRSWHAAPRPRSSAMDTHTAAGPLLRASARASASSSFSARSQPSSSSHARLRRMPSRREGALCLTHCLLCWRCSPAHTVASGRQNAFASRCWTQSKSPFLQRETSQFFILLTFAVCKIYLTVTAILNLLRASNKERDYWS